MSSDHDPERHSFEVREATGRDLSSGGGHILQVTRPTYGDGGYVSSTVHNFSLAELADLHDLIGAYLDSQRADDITCSGQDLT